MARNVTRQIDATTVSLKLTQGYETLIDREDLPRVGEYLWRAQRNRRDAYAVTQVRTLDGSRPVFLHNLLLGLRGVDHRDGDGLNNRRANLRPASLHQNARNRRRRSDNRTGYKGVTWYGGWRFYAARIVTADGRRFLGAFQSAEEAARAYDEAARRFHGEFARLNFPGVGEMPCGT